MTVKEMIEKLQGMNPEAIIISDSSFDAINKEPADLKFYINNVCGVNEIQQSDDKKYVRMW